MATRKKRILFVSEAITLAQIVRLVALARALDPQRYEIHFASSSFPEFVFAGLPFSHWPLWGLSSETALARVAAGKRLYSSRVLARYIAADRAVINEVRPDLIVGDLRWSLSVSAPLSGVPFAALINAYWSPYAQRNGFPMPDHPIVRLLGIKLAAQYFPKFLPRVFAHFAAPLNRQRQLHGLPALGSLLEVLTHGDFTLYADPPALFPVQALPRHHVFLGPVLWSAPGSLPADWGARADRAPVYVTLGSSGAAKSLGAVLTGLADLPIDVLLATAGRSFSDRLPANVRAVPFIDGAAACARARVVVHNGGSSTGYQALAVGKPLLGIPHNLDQYLATERIDGAGAGLSLRAGAVRAEQVAAAVTRLLNEPHFGHAAAKWAPDFQRPNAGASFSSWLDGVLH